MKSELDEQADSVMEFQRARPESSSPRPKPQPKQRRPDMSRATQTKWICGTILGIVLVGAIYMLGRPDPYDIDAMCRGWFGYEDKACLADRASDRIRNGYSF